MNLTHFFFQEGASLRKREKSSTRFGICSAVAAQQLTELAVTLCGSRQVCWGLLPHADSLDLIHRQPQKLRGGANGCHRGPWSAAAD